MPQTTDGGVAVTAGPHHLSWTEGPRLLRAWHEPTEPVNGEHAEVLVRWVRDAVGDPDPAPYGWVVDASELVGTTQEARRCFAGLLRDHAEAAHVAWHSCNDEVAVTVRLLQRVVPELHGALLAHEDEAMAWLGERVPTL